MNAANPFLANGERPRLLGAAQQEALARMRLVVEDRTLGVLTGEVGSGKSTLLALLADELPQADYQVIWLSSSRMTSKELYAGLLKALGETPAFSAVRVRQQWHDLLEARTSAQARPLAVMIDEAHEWPEPSLLELRFLMTQGKNPHPAFPVVLAGQGKLRRTLNTNLLEPIAQRVRMQYHLTGLTLPECQAYLDDRMLQAGRERPVFTESAAKAIFAATQGIPRVVNLIAGNALMLTLKNNENAVDERHVVSVLADMDRQRGVRGA